MLKVQHWLSGDGEQHDDEAQKEIKCVIFNSCRIWHTLFAVRSSNTPDEIRVPVPANRGIVLAYLSA